MKIIHLVLGKANPERMNGINKIAHNLVTHQFNQNYDVCLWGIANSLERNYPKRVYPTRLFLQQKNKLFLDKNLLYSLKMLPKDTIFHMHGGFIPEFAKVGNILNKRGIQYVYTPHGCLTQGALSQGNFKKKVYFSLIEKNLIRNAKMVHLTGINEVTDLESLTDDANKCLIPNGQDFSVFPNFKDDIVLNDNSIPVFGFCGRLAIHHKGLDLMIEGFAEYIKSGKLARLELIGDGDERIVLEELAKDLGVADAVVFHGAKFGDEKFRIINNFDVFLHTSRNEGFPTAVVEAAAMSIPCMTSDATSFSDYLIKHKAGFAIKDNNPVGIAREMSRASDHYHDGSLDAMARNAKEMVKKEFDWNCIARQLIEVYQS